MKLSSLVGPDMSTNFRDLERLTKIISFLQGILPQSPVDSERNRRGNEQNSSSGFTGSFNTKRMVEVCGENRVKPRWTMIGGKNENLPSSIFRCSGQSLERALLQIEVS